MTVIAFRARFSGIYEWGSGWTSKSAMEAWHEWFQNMDSVVAPAFWRHFHRDAMCGSDHLVCSSGAVFLHPMDIGCVLHTELTSKKYDGDRLVEIFPEIDELKEILQGAANACGGMAEFSEVVKAEVPTPRFMKPEEKPDED